jgi:hypothetical protein
MELEFRPYPRIRTKYFLQLFTSPLLFYLLFVILLAFMMLVIIPPGPWVSWIWFNTLLWGSIFCFILHNYDKVNNQMLDLIRPYCSGGMR